MLIRRLLVGALVAPLAFATPVAAQDGVTVIRAAKVIDGRGAALANGEVVVQGGKITKVGARGAAPAGEATLVDATGEKPRVVKEGLVPAAKVLEAAA